MERAEISIARLMEAYSVGDEGALAVQLGRDLGTLRVWRSRDVVPNLVLIEASKATGYAVEWLRGDLGAEKSVNKAVPPSQLTEREAALLANYRAASEEGRRALEWSGAAFAQQAQAVKPGRGKKAA